MGRERKGRECKGRMKKETIGYQIGKDRMRENEGRRKGKTRMVEWNGIG